MLDMPSVLSHHGMRHPLPLHPCSAVRRRFEEKRTRKPDMARILIIDDDPIMRDMLREMLEEHGYEIAEAGDGDEGMASYRQHPADLIITDILMPGKEGLATIYEVRREFPDAKIIAISGGGITGKDYLPLAEELGAISTFTKPFRYQELIEAVEKALGKRE